MCLFKSLILFLIILCLFQCYLCRHLSCAGSRTHPCKPAAALTGTCSKTSVTTKSNIRFYAQVPHKKADKVSESSIHKTVVCCQQGWENVIFSGFSNVMYTVFNTYQLQRKQNPRIIVKNTKFLMITIKLYCFVFARITHTALYCMYSDF